MRGTSLRRVLGSDVFVCRTTSSEGASMATPLHPFSWCQESHAASLAVSLSLIQLLSVLEMPLDNGSGLLRVCL